MRSAGLWLQGWGTCSLACPWGSGGSGQWSRGRVSLVSRGGDSREPHRDWATSAHLGCTCLEEGLELERGRA